MYKKMFLSLAIATGIANANPCPDWKPAIMIAQKVMLDDSKDWQYDRYLNTMLGRAFVFPDKIIPINETTCKLVKVRYGIVGGGEAI